MGFCAARMPLWYAVDVIYDQFPTLFVMFWTIGILVAAISTFITVFLMYEHYRTGLTKLGFMNAETNFTIKILALQPVFVFTALLSLFEPDMGYFFEAIQTLMLGWVLFYLISYCVYVLGGSAKFLQHATSCSKTQLWNHFPGCCVWIFFRFCCKTLDKESTPTVEQIMGPVRWMITQFVVLPSFLIWLLLALDSTTSADRATALYCISAFTWVSTLVGMYAVHVLFSWIRPIEIAFDKDLDSNDGLMIGGIADEKGTLLSTELRISAGSGSGAAAEPGVAHSVMGAKEDEGNDIHGRDDNKGKANTELGCCVKCTASTQTCWNWFLDFLFREEPRTFGEQFVLRRKLMYIQVHFFQTLTLLGFLRLFMPRLITADNRWVDEIQMCHAWAGFIVICSSLPISLFSWFAFPVAAYAVSDQGSDAPEPMREIATRVIPGPSPAEFPPEPYQVAELAMLVGTKHDANYQFHNGIGVETNPEVVSDRVSNLSDML